VRREDRFVERIEKKRGVLRREEGRERSVERRAEKRRE
jgi:hypothetical protein